MDSYFSRYYTFLKEKSLKLDYPSHLDMLYTVYTRRHPIDSQEIRECFDSMEHILHALSAKRRHALLRAVLNVCAAYERSAFIEGIQIGAQLMQEITKATEQNKTE